jgi:hypothetical protein
MLIRRVYINNNSDEGKTEVDYYLVCLLDSESIKNVWWSEIFSQN